ncbi:MAG TPA: lamin tail domain-containing protein [Myxococcota bacterium]|nr:lamin tail domain-containing protein [Myxococcota bacterium]
MLDTDAADTDPADTDLPPPPPVLLLTEIADTVDASARFVEITNLTGADVDTSGWALVRYSNGSPTGTSHDLDVIAVADGASFVVAYSAPDFEAAFGYAPEMTWGGVNQNGNDAFALTYEGVIVDVFGELGVDGLGTAWEYVDASATRRAIAQAPRPSATFELRDWYIRTTTKVTPGRWGAPYDDSTPLPDTGGDSGDSDAPGDSDLIVDSGATGDSAGDTDVRESIPVAVDDTDVVPPRDTAPGVEGQLMLSEIADPIAASDAKYVELYNPSDAPVDLARWELARYSNGSTTGAFRRLPHAWLRPGAAYVVAYDAAEFEAFFGFAPDSTWGGVTGNGNDVYALYEVAAGRSTPYDLYGQLGVDGTGLGWDYANAVATRRETATGPRSRFDLHEWLVTIEGYTPGSWSPAPGGTELDTWFYDTSALDQAPDTAIDTDTTPPAVDTGAPRVILSEIADPGLFDARYVELYNAGPRTRHLGSWAVEIYANGGVQPTTHVLPSIDLGPGEVWVIGFTGAGFRSAWGFAPDDRWTGLTGNGDDVYALARWTGAAWTVVDVYGEIGTDGAGTPWAYPSQDAARDPGVTRGVDVFDLAEWTLSADPAAFTPGTRP